MTYKSRPLTKFEQRQLEYEQRKRQEYFERKKRERIQLRQVSAKNKKSTLDFELDAKLRDWHLLKLLGKQHKYRDLKDFF